MEFFSIDANVAEGGMQRNPPMNRRLEAAYEQRWAVT